MTGKRFLIGLLACALPVCALGGDAAQPAAAEVARQNQQGLDHFKRGYYDLAPKGRTAEAEQELKLAEEAFKKAAEADKDFLDAHRNLARLYELQKNYLHAAMEYAEVIRLDPENIDAYAHMALVQLELGRADEAVRYLEAAKARTNDARTIQQLDNYIARAKQYSQ